MDNAGREVLISKVPAIIRGLLAEPSGNDDKPYNTVILKSLLDQEAHDYTNSNQKLRVLQIDLADSPGPLEEIRRQIAEKIDDHSRKYGRKPSAVSILLSVKIPALLIKTSRRGYPEINSAANF